MAACVVYVPPLIGWAQQTVDQEKLAILNDALNRYKCEGGNVQALTAGAPISDVITALKTPVNWAGVTHQFLQSAFTVPGRSISWSGSGTQYAFTGYNTYTATPGGYRSGQKSRVYLTAVGTGNWSVPADWTNNNSIECIGGGGSGVLSGGGGGAYARITNFSTNAGASIPYQVGGTAQDSWFNGSNLATSSCGAQGGSSAVSTTIGTGGQASASIGTQKCSGGNGGLGSTFPAGGGGGGAAGPQGNGGSGGGTNCWGAGGGGGNGGGSNGHGSPNTNIGGDGGDNAAGTGHGLGYSSGSHFSSAGTNGGGGGGGGCGSQPDTPSPGGNGTEWDSGHGSGGGGGGGGYDFGNSSGGLYGGGAGGRSSSTGAQGIIVISYTH